MSYITKYSKIRPFVKLNIPHNKKMFSTQEKALITKYDNKLKAMGYYNREQEGYIFKDISNSKYKVKSAPRIKTAIVNVGTKIIDGKIKTDTSAKAKIKNGKIYVVRKGMADTWRFSYDIKRDWNLEDFKKHILQQMGQKNLKEGQVFAIGAGIYTMKGTREDKLEILAQEILAMANRYASQNQNLEGEDDETQYKEYEKFMTEIVVYDSKEVLAFYDNIKVKKRKKKLKKGKRN